MAVTNGWWAAGKANQKNAMVSAGWRITETIPDGDYLEINWPALPSPGTVSVIVVDPGAGSGLVKVGEFYLAGVPGEDKGVRGKAYSPVTQDLPRHFEPGQPLKTIVFNDASGGNIQVCVIADLTRIPTASFAARTEENGFDGVETHNDGIARIVSP